MFNFSNMELLAGSSGWDVRTFLENAFGTVGDWLALGLMILGVAAIGLAIWQITTGLMSQGQKQTKWGLSITLLLLGGVLAMPTGFSFIQGIAKGGRQTIEDLGGQTIVLFQFAKTFLP
ncbi:hypothetical protein HXA34_20755 [Salipaludibacillus agaradhaerens]|jgi:hypothetical protein|uniref:hypothetical protein n=1 Tax=Salipaludibacillus agaradhaerens TaxID=76935 RepID=UPI00215076C7|nr:hypothetical protein [Salipaludibacillus agaradhaerens]MCR6108731.1 hypothetical protein [Salipaludibacillus agaradhaerens]MCR6120754.1 hypothetical protein [Salipaludibacillus agaradhaerens]